MKTLRTTCLTLRHNKSFITHIPSKSTFYQLWMSTNQRVLPPLKGTTLITDHLLNLKLPNSSHLISHILIFNPKPPFLVFPTTHMNFLQWNMRGFEANRDNLNLFSRLRNVDLIMLQETKTRGRGKVQLARFTTFEKVLRLPPQLLPTGA